jgi:hypothetical protein
MTARPASTAGVETAGAFSGLTLGQLTGGAAIASLFAAGAAVVLLAKGAALSVAVLAGGLYVAFLFTAPPFWLAFFLVVFIPFNSLIAQFLATFAPSQKEWFSIWKEALLAVGVVRVFWRGRNRRATIAANAGVLVWSGVLMAIYLAIFAWKPSTPGIFAFSLETKYITVMLFFLFLDLDAERAATLVRAMVWSVGLVALYGLIQYFWDYERLLPLVLNPVDVYADELPRLYSYSLSALEPAFAADIGILILFSGFARPPLRTALPWLALLFPCLVLTYTRSAYIGLLFGAAAVFAMNHRGGARYAAGIAAAGSIACGALLLGGPAVWKSNFTQRLESIVQQTDLSSAIHKQRMQHAFETISKNPLGVGLGNYGTIQARFEGYEEADYAENSVLQVAVETGLAGGIAYIGLTAAVLVALFGARRWQDEKQRRLAACALGVFVAMTAAGVVLPIWEALVPLVYTWALVGTVLAKRVEISV